MEDIDSRNSRASNLADCDHDVSIAAMPAADRDSLVAAMPASGRELVEIIGLDKALKLLRTHGGKRLFIASTLTDESMLVGLLGRALADKLAKRWGGERFELPTLSSLDRQLRDNAIRRDFDDAVTLDALVDRYRLTHRHIRKLLRASVSTAPALRPDFRRGRYTDDL